MAEKKQQRPATTLAPLTPGQQSLADIARQQLIMRMLAAQGQNGDTMLAHISPQEARALQMMSGPGGAQGAPHPVTGLPQFFGVPPGALDGSGIENLGQLSGGAEAGIPGAGMPGSQIPTNDFAPATPPPMLSPFSDPRVAHAYRQIQVRFNGQLDPAVALQQAKVAVQTQDAVAGADWHRTGAFSGGNPLTRAQQAAATAHTGVPNIVTPPPASFPAAPASAPIAMAPQGPMGGGTGVWGPQSVPMGGGPGVAGGAPGIGTMSPLPGSPMVQAPPVAAPTGMGTIGAQLAQNLDPVTLQRLLGQAGGGNR